MRGSPDPAHKFDRRSPSASVCADDWRPAVQKRRGRETRAEPRFAPTIRDLRSKSGGVGRPAPSRFLNGIAFNAQPEAPAGRSNAGASGWALNDASEKNLRVQSSTRSGAVCLFLFSPSRWTEFRCSNIAASYFTRREGETSGGHVHINIPSGRPHLRLPKTCAQTLLQ